MAQFGVTAVFGDVAEAFGEASSSELATQVGLSGTTVGLGLALIRLAGAGSLLGSSLADRVGRRRTIVLATVIGLVGTLIAAGAPTYWTFVVLVALARPTLSTTNAMTAVIAAEESGSKDRAMAIAFVGAAYAAGTGIVSILRGVVDGIGFRTVLLVSAAPIVLVPLLARGIEEPPPAKDALEAPPTARLGGVPAHLRPRLLLVVSMALVSSWITGPGFTYLFVYGENVLGATPGSMAGLVVGAGVSGLLGLLVGRWAADRIGRRVTAAVGTMLMALFTTFAYSGSLGRFTAGYLLAIGASGAVGPAAGALLNEIVPASSRGTANGWAAASGVVGAVLGLAAFGALADVFGAFTTAGALMWLPVAPLALLYFRIPETRGMEHDQIEAATAAPPS